MFVLNRMVVGTLEVIPTGILWRFARRYVAGVSLEDAIGVVRELNKQGLLATLDILGEHVTSPSEAREDGAAYGEALETIQRERLACNISVKPTHMGLKLDRDLCLEILRELAGTAGRLGSFLRLDMEDSTCTDDTLSFHRTLSKETPGVGVVLQSYLKRSREDAHSLAEQRANVRLCKGIYREPESIAFQDRNTIRQNFIALLEILMRGGSYVGIATHDPWVIQEARQLIGRLGIARDGYEFQMLLGVRPDLRQQLRREGERLRIYVPYGANWRSYCLRRFRENPEILRYVVRELFRRKS